MTRLDPALPMRSALRLVTRSLAEAGIAPAEGEARFLTLGLLGLSPTELALRGAAPIGADGAARLEDGLARRLSGEPVARILGEWEFWGLTFALSPATLVPRPDTETLVETALALHAKRDAPLRILDLGTGSGCILVALLRELPRARGVGLDRSPEALATARANAAAHGVAHRARFVAGDWGAALRGPFDLVVSNPPYVASAAIPTLAVEVRRHDPGAALDGGADGLLAYRRIVREAPVLLANGGALVLEVGYDQAEAVAALGRAAGFARMQAARDLAGHARVLTLRQA